MSTKVIRHWHCEGHTHRSANNTHIRQHCEGHTHRSANNTHIRQHCEGHTHRSANNTHTHKRRILACVINSHVWYVILWWYVILGWVEFSGGMPFLQWYSVVVCYPCSGIQWWYVVPVVVFSGGMS
jgi:hypothetical protein